MLAIRSPLDDFVEEMQCKLDPEQSLNDIARFQKQVRIKQQAYFSQWFSIRDETKYLAFISGRYTLSEAGKCLL